MNQFLSISNQAATVQCSVSGRIFRTSDFADADGNSNQRFLISAKLTPAGNSTGLEARIVECSEYGGPQNQQRIGFLRLLKRT
jgi:hypothetical protein